MNFCPAAYSKYFTWSFCIFRYFWSPKMKILILKSQFNQKTFDILPETII